MITINKQTDDLNATTLPPFRLAMAFCGVDANAPSGDSLDAIEAVFSSLWNSKSINVILTVFCIHSVSYKMIYEVALT